MASLTAEKVRGLRDRKRYGDGGGLYLYLAPREPSPGFCG